MNTQSLKMRLHTAIAKEDSAAAALSNTNRPRIDNDAGRMAQLLEDALNRIIDLESFIISAAIKLDATKENLFACVENDQTRNAG